MIDVHEKCERHAQSASDLARLVARGRGEKPNFDTAQKIRKQCQALPYPSDQDVNWLNKNQLTVYHEMEEILIATGRFQERNQVATERIMRNALQQLIEVEARLGTIEMMWSLSGCGQSYIIDSLRNQPFRKHASWGVGVSRWPETHTRAFSAEGYDTLRDNAPREMHALYTPTRHGQCADAL